MKVSKAIELIEYWQSGGTVSSWQDLNTAIKLGIEALKRCQLKEPFASFHLGEPLSGQTPEDDTT